MSMACGRLVSCWMVAALFLAAPLSSAWGGDSAAELAAKACGALVGRVDDSSGVGPIFLRSYDGAGGHGPPAEPALANAAFTYDNALAAIALIACGRRSQALRLGEALLAAVNHDRAGENGRLRNAYRAGAQSARPIPPMGWWDAAAGRWLEDPYQVGTATGNVAWGSLALLTLYEATDDRRFRDGAARLAGWAVEHARDVNGAGGFSGGVHGFDEAPGRLGWKSTEHNADLAAVFVWLRRAGAPGDWPTHEAAARSFLNAMWIADSGRFAIGTAPDGVGVNRVLSGLDAQLWPLLLPRAPVEWQRALAWVERAHAVDGGFDFNDDRDGLWVEGTAQAALVYRIVGRTGDAERLFAQLAKEVSRGGYFWATRQPSITTGLAIGPDSPTDDFRYYRLPHLGATAWVALAVQGWNPFSGARGP